MTLIDAGPLIALIDRGEPEHEACVACLARLTGPFLTTWPPFTEAMYLLGEAGGWRAQEALWIMLDQSDLQVIFQGPEHFQRIRALMQKYTDRPMDLADASLVCLAEQRGIQDIFTLDRRDFLTYRFAGRRPFRLWPET
ncbi:MAG: PIN domain-containing protein [Desulfurellaceae bacterium]|nr:PIN domain-containing protein [Desulfurellaceae bacterium]